MTVNLPSKSEKQHLSARGILRHRLGAMAVVFFLCVLCFATTSSAAANAVTSAKNNSISGGKFVTTSKGIRYQKKNKSYVKNTWAMIGGKIYRFNKSGYVQRGSFSVSGKYYYAASSGAVYVNKWLKVSAGTYYYGSDAARKRSAKVLIGGKYYYFLSNGKMATSKWVRVGGKYYFFGATGTMFTETWIGSYYVNANGVRTSSPTKAAIKKATAQTVLASKSRLIIVGASRVREMMVAVQDAGMDSVKMGGVSSKTVFIARTGATYSWASSTAIKELDKYLSLFPKSTVVMQFGNNDLSSIKSGRIDQYIALYGKLIRKYPQAEFYFMDALPGKEATNALNQRRIVFNQKLKEAFPAHAIGGFDYLMTAGFSTSYNCNHYSAATSRKIFQFILKQAGL